MSAPKQMPSIGRIVLVHRPADGSEYWPAIITYVWSASCVNVGGFGKEGQPFALTSVLLYPDDMPVQDSHTGPIAVWPTRNAMRAELPHLHAAAVPAADEAALEAHIQARGLNAPRLSPEQIDDAIVGKQFYVFPGTTLTVCCLTLRNGFSVTGESAAASPTNFKADIGEAISFKAARDKVWALEGYLLRQRLQQSSAAAEACMSAEGKALVEAGVPIGARAGLPSVATK